MSLSKARTHRAGPNHSRNLGPHRSLLATLLSSTNINAVNVSSSPPINPAPLFLHTSPPASPLHSPIPTENGLGNDDCFFPSPERSPTTANFSHHPVAHMPAPEQRLSRREELARAAMAMAASQWINPQAQVGEEDTDGGGSSDGNGDDDFDSSMEKTLSAMLLQPGNVGESDWRPDLAGSYADTTVLSSFSQVYSPSFLASPSRINS